MPDSDDFRLALSHYRQQFPDLASLGTSVPPAAYQAEYARLAACGLSATLIVANSYEGGSATAIQNFPQKTLLLALIQRRAELDETFDAAVNAPINVTPRRQMGIRVVVTQP